METSTITAIARLVTMAEFSIHRKNGHFSMTPERFPRVKLVGSKDLPVRRMSAVGVKVFDAIQINGIIHTAPMTRKTAVYNTDRFRLMRPFTASLLQVA
jgi:hypothetical protein